MSRFGIDHLVRDCFRTKKATPIMELCTDENCSPQFFRETLDLHRNLDFLNKQDPELNVTPLMVLACRGSLQANAVALCRILLEPKYGVDVNIRGQETNSEPIYGAAELGSPEIVKMLIDKGANILSRTPPIATTPINLAIQNNHIQVAVHLVNAAQQQKKNIFNTTNMYYQSAIILAMIRQRMELIGIMAKAGGADLRYGFHAFWAINPHDEEKCDYMDPDPTASRAHDGLYKTVYSYVSLSCCKCGNPGTKKMMKCSRCTMAHYCSGACQKADWKTHKTCCKKLHAGTELVDGDFPAPSSQPAGFIEPYDATNDRTSEGPDDDDDYYDRDEHPVWEYHSGRRGKMEWKRYPPFIEQEIESLLNLGSPRYMYRPNDRDSSGMFESPPLPRTAPRGVSTRYVYYSVMMEFDIYTGAARAVRRNGSNKPAEPRGMFGF